MAVLILNYSRSGGTLLSAVLGQLADVILVSEVNPISNASSTIRTQVKQWYNIDIKAKSFKESVIELEAYCLKNKKTLIIRDFSFADFTPHEMNSFKPALTFSSLKEIQSVIDLRVISFVRDAYDIWISRNCPPKFSAGYLAFVQKLVDLQVPSFKYEDFCDSPELELFKICKVMGISYQKKALITPNLYTNVTGDNQIERVSRGRKQNKITRLHRKQIPKKWVEFAKADLKIQEANTLMNYSSNFDETEIDVKSLNWVNSLQWKWYRYRNPSHFHSH